MILSARKVAVVVLILGVISSSPFFALAKDDSNTTNPNSGTQEAVMKRTPVLTPAKKENMQDRTDSGTANIQNRIENTKERVETRIASREARLQELRMAFEKNKEELKTRMATREALLKAKLKSFKDQQKAQVAERVSGNLNKLNIERINQMNQTLNKLSNVVGKLQKVATNSALKVKDPTVVQTGIDNAKGAINLAQDAVNIQAGRDYTLIATSEAKIKSDVQAKRDQLKLDIEATYQNIIIARKSVSDVIYILKSNISGGENGK